MAKEGVGGTTGMPWATIVIHEACNPTVWSGSIVTTKPGSRGEPYIAVPSRLGMRLKLLVGQCLPNLVQCGVAPKLRLKNRVGSRVWFSPQLPIKYLPQNLPQPLLLVPQLVRGCHTDLLMQS
jgi:hypothetical protein